MPGIKFLTGKDYPNHCATCRATIDSVVPIVAEGPDTDDPEAPHMFVYDHKMFCGGRECLVTDRTCVKCGYTADKDDHFHHTVYVEGEAKLYCSVCRDDHRAQRVTDKPHLAEPHTNPVRTCYTCDRPINNPKPCGTCQELNQGLLAQTP